ncbi:MAG: hypothetical protein A3K66_02945 [Euryarchaeota archaeon RBG_16_67_27]|nr:MAG: hypothetical protein A3K66_02945 [Euryarchaeota archaeon RBG_16_67_27]
METTTSMPGKQARALCPVCQEPLPPDETECDNCGAFVIDEAVVRLSRAFGLDREKALQLVDAGFRHPRQLHDRDVAGVLERRESGLLFICTNCGSFVAGKDNRCTRCHVEFEAEEEPAWSGERDILDLVLCPNCGADNTPDWEECEICGEPLRAGPPRRAESKPSRPGPVHPKEPTEPFDDHSRMLTELDALLAVEDEPPPDPGSGPSEDDPGRRAPGRPIPDEPSEPPAPRERPGDPPPHAEPMSRAPIRAGRGVVRSPKSVRLVRHAADLRGRRRRLPGADRPAREAPTGEKFADPVAPGVLAATAALIAIQASGGADEIAWGLAFATAMLVAYGLATSFPSRIGKATRIDGLLLLAGVALGIGAPWVFSLSPGAGTLAAALPAVPLALSTRRLAGTPARSFLSAAAGAVLVALAHAAATRAAISLAAAWPVGVVAVSAWPAVIALTDVRRALASRNLRGELLEAERRIERRDYAASAESYDRAIALAGGGTGSGDLPWYGKGATLVMLGRYEEALRAIDHALDINPRNEVAWLNKGNALAKLGRQVDALRCFNAAIKVNPDYEVAWNNKGNALARLGRFEEALRCYERALGVDPGYRGAWVNKGYVLAKLGRFDEAASCADRVLTLRDRTRLEPA